MEDKEKIVKALTDVDKDVEKEVERKKMDLIKAIINTEPKGDPVTEMARLTFLRDLLKDFSKKTDTEDEKVLSKVLTWAMVNQALQSTQKQPDLTTLMSMMNMMKSDGGDWSKFMQTWLQLQAQAQQQQAQTQQQLITMLFGKQKSDIEDMKNRTEEMIRRLDDKINMLASSKEQPGIKDYLQQIIEVRDTLRDVIDKLGIVEKSQEVVDDKGKLQLGRLLDRGLKLAERVIEKMPAQQPEPKQVQMMPVQEIPQAPTEQTVEPEPIEIKPLEEKIEKLEEEMKKMDVIMPEKPKVEEPKAEPVKEKPAPKPVKAKTEVKPKVEVKKEEKPITKHEPKTSEKTVAEGPKKQKSG